MKSLTVLLMMFCGLWAIDAQSSPVGVPCNTQQVNNSGDKVLDVSPFEQYGLVVRHAALTDENLQAQIYPCVGNGLPAIIVYGKPESYDWGYGGFFNTGGKFDTASGNSTDIGDGGGGNKKPKNGPAPCLPGTTGPCFYVKCPPNVVGPCVSVMGKPYMLSLSYGQTISWKMGIYASLETCMAAGTSYVNDTQARGGFMTRVMVTLFGAYMYDCSPY